MSRHVKIAVIGRPPAHGVKNMTGTGQNAVDHMLRHCWGENALPWVLPDRPDLIVLPEQCDRYPNLSVEERRAYYRTRANQGRDFFAGVARQHNCYIAYSAAREAEDGALYNSTQILDRTGRVAGVYDKNHPTVDETEIITPGSSAPVIQCDFGTVACAICFDLNFDELRLQYARGRPDIILFSSMYHGGLMQRYWAYSCRAHFAGAIAGQPSAILSPVGEIIASSTSYRPYVVATVNLDCAVAHLDVNGSRGRLTALKAKYGPKVTVFAPDHLGSVLITCETEECTVHDMVREFEIEMLDDYFARSREVQREKRRPAGRVPCA